MTPFICRKCKAETWILREDGCPNCVDRNFLPDAHLHQRNKYGMTRAHRMRIKTNKQVDRNVWKPDSRWRDTYE